MTILNTEELPEKVRSAYVPFVKNLIETHGDNLLSVFIYGSATGKNFLPKFSDINSVMVVKHMTIDTLQKSLKLVAGVKHKRIAAPLILTQEHIRSSLDVFPIEFLDMQSNSIVVFGDDLLRDLVIKDEYVRLFCEQQIKGKLIRIRQAYLEVGLNNRGIELLLRESLNSLMPVFRCLLRLKGLSIPEDKGELLNQAGKAMGVDTTIMIAIWKEKKNDERVGRQHAREAFGDYIRQLERLAEAVDRL